MITEKKSNYTFIISDETSFSDFFNAFSISHKKLENKHLIIQISQNLNINIKEISLLLSLSDIHKSNGTSFVVVCSGIDIDALPEDFNIVPTLQEAEDVLEMEEIERDLGF